MAVEDHCTTELICIENKSIIIEIRISGDILRIRDGMGKRIILTEWVVEMSDQTNKNMLVKGMFFGAFITLILGIIVNRMEDEMVDSEMRI